MPDANTDGEWTVVRPRNKRRLIHPPSSGRPVDCIPLVGREEVQCQQDPADLEVDPIRESKLMQKMEMCMEKLRSSRYYVTFMDQMQSPEVSNCFSKVLGTETKMLMLIYGIGSIESYEPPRMQLCLAHLIKKKFDWVGEIEVFDPVLNATESKVLEKLGCSVLSKNEQGRREATKPVLFFMPHCESELYNNMLEANWRVDRLRNIALFGNSFETYEQQSALVSYHQNSNQKHLKAVRSLTDEFKVDTVEDDYFNAFQESSWHFFSPHHEQPLPDIDS